MKNLSVYLEKNGESILAGYIRGNTPDDASFYYSDAYLMVSENRPISISLPLQEDPFSPEQTKCFFDGLLPEGFTRRCVAGWIHADENNYLSILSELGKECLGALKIVEDNTEDNIQPEYHLLSKEEVCSLAAEGAAESAQLVTKSHLSLAGASGKAGLYYDEQNENWYLPLGEAPSTHIVKQSHVRLNGIVANEQLSLLTARKLGIDAAESFIINTGNYEEGEVLFASRRFDRVIPDNAHMLNGLPVPLRLHQEDFAQAMGIPSAFKYERDNKQYLKLSADILRANSADPITDILKLWDLCVFNYLLGNTDNHIKNLSLLYSSDLKSIRLAPAYDLISTVIYESSTEEMALSIGGVYDLSKIGVNEFKAEAQNIGLGQQLAMKRFDEIASKFENTLSESTKELEDLGLSGIDSIKELILRRGGLNSIN